MRLRSDNSMVVIVLLGEMLHQFICCFWVRKKKRPPPNFRAKLIHRQVWLPRPAPTQRDPYSPRTITLSLYLQLFVVSIFTAVIILQNRTWSSWRRQVTWAGRWPRAGGGRVQSGTLLTAPSSAAAYFCLIFPHFQLKNTVGQAGAKKGLSICVALTLPPTFQAQSTPAKQGSLPFCREKRYQ